MRIGIPKEIHKGEKRTAATPETVAKLITLGFSVIVESGTGIPAGYTDGSYSGQGAEIESDTEKLWRLSDIILKVRPPGFHTGAGRHEADFLAEGKTLISFIQPAENKALLETFNANKANVLAMDCVPRITRAQKIDALTSMANIAGYRAVIEAASHFGRFFTGQITAAGSVPPAKVLVIGAGIAGLSAIGTANGLGAIVRSFDTRPEVKEQVESMGASFLELDFKEDGNGAGGYAKVMSPEFIKAEMELFSRQAKEVDVIITTAMIPGKKAPLLLSADLVKSMKRGSVIVDLASEQGGNCELTEPGKVTEKHGVTLIGYTDMVSRLPAQSSRLYGNNLLRLMEELTPEKDGILNLNMDDGMIRSMTVVLKGETIWPPPAIEPAPVAPRPEKPEKKAETTAPPKAQKKERGFGPILALAVSAVLLLLLGKIAPPDFLKHLTVFVLACFTGYMVVWNVTPALHTPLMSVTNAISGIIVIGALLQVSGPGGGIVTILGAIAVFIATINIAGGFLVTQRMLKMFKKRGNNG
ncbi:MAG: Re/Si-specific NAD(P)(+) transhydrogenase subunit alpha [Desulfobacteraceae bacterium]|nr:Re/Si-specific NAD(P)(+) transhydrogenase subunit alpha [Desulfobacteraceae bacterium]